MEEIFCVCWNGVSYSRESSNPFISEHCTQKKDDVYKMVRGPAAEIMVEYEIISNSKEPPVRACRRILGGSVQRPDVLFLRKRTSARLSSFAYRFCRRKTARRPDSQFLSSQDPPTAPTIMLLHASMCNLLRDHGISATNLAAVSMIAYVGSARGTCLMPLYMIVMLLRRIYVRHTFYS